MPIEIKELVIRTSVSDQKEEASSPDSGGETSNIIAECVEQVMEILKEKEER
jgi:hypothetical protein